MEKGGSHCAVVVGKGGRHPSGDVNGMTLVGVILVPEDPGARTVEVPRHEFLVEGPGRPGRDEAEEPADQVPAVRQVLGQRFDLQSTQRRDIGRYAIRSLPISSPHDAQIP